MFCFFSLFKFRGHSTREPAYSSVTYSILRAYTGTGVKHSQHRKKHHERFWKNAGEWTGRAEISQEDIPGSKRSMYGYIWPTPGFRGRTFKLCVLTRGNFNFCVRSSPLKSQRHLCDRHTTLSFSGPDPPSDSVVRPGWNSYTIRDFIGPLHRVSVASDRIVQLCQSSRLSLIWSIAMGVARRYAISLVYSYGN